MTDEMKRLWDEFFHADEVLQATKQAFILALTTGDAEAAKRLAEVGPDREEAVRCCYQAAWHYTEQHWEDISTEELQSMVGEVSQRIERSHRNSVAMHEAHAPC